MSLTQLAPASRGTVESIDWARLAQPEAKRLRELGLDEGVSVEMVHRAGGGPIACRIGRMTVALRRRVANVIHVIPAG